MAQKSLLRSERQLGARYGVERRWHKSQRYIKNQGHRCSYAPNGIQVASNDGSATSHGLYRGLYKSPKGQTMKRTFAPIAFAVMLACSCAVTARAQKLSEEDKDKGLLLLEATKNEVLNATKGPTRTMRQGFVV
jgi:hypothetical protein